jgi:hypothetical protein
MSSSWPNSSAEVESGPRNDREFRARSPTAVVPGTAAAAGRSKTHPGGRDQSEPVAEGSMPMLDPTATLILDWLRQIGLSVCLAPVDADSFLPGVTLKPGGLIVDPESLLYPGDLLHEAGHLATILSAQRASAGSNAGSDMGEEIAAQTWSYAATVQLGLPPEIVFHPAGYKGAATTLIQTYCDGKAGVPLLQWMGLPLDRSEPPQPPFLHTRT